MSVNGEEGEGWFDRSKLTFIAVLVIGIIIPGMARWILGNAGYPTIGAIVFVLGYATMVFVLWFGWVRPMDISGPD